MHKMNKCSIVSDSQVSYVRNIVSNWLLEMLHRVNKVKLDYFRVFDWVVKSKDCVIKNILEKAKKEKINIKPFNSFDLDDDPYACVHLIESFCRDYKNFNQITKKEIQIELENVKKNKVFDESYDSAKKRMKKYLCLDKVSQKICEAVYILYQYDVLDNYFCDYRQFNNLRLLAYILGLSIAEVQNSVDKLLELGVLDVEHNDLIISNRARHLWTSGEIDKKYLFGHSMEGECLKLDEFHLNSLEVLHVKKLFESNSNKPTHILLYGAPGTGKTTFVRSLAKECKMKTLSVSSPDNKDNGERDRRLALNICLNIAKQNKETIIVVDEAERLLDTSNFYNGTKDKAWLNNLLENSQQKIVWITNNVAHIDSAVKRRFSMSIYFEQLGYNERCQVWNRIVSKERVCNLITKKDIDKLALSYPVEAAVIKKSVTQAADLYSDKESFISSLEMLLNAHCTLENNGINKHDKKLPINDFCVEGIGTNDNINSLLNRCQRMDKAMRDGIKIRPSSGNMLFYGISGGGKSALAQYIARMIGRECIVQRASDLLSPYVGETEQKIALAFRKAERQGAVLVIDEADSFIYNRNDTERNYEVTMVNEFLTQLEEFCGFCICTTNRKDELDPAMMRRFSFKIKFEYVNNNQKLVLYKNMFSSLCKKPLSSKQKARLYSLSHLTAGDFNVVRTNFDPLYCDYDEINNDMLIAALEKEESLKIHDKGNCIGF